MKICSICKTNRPLSDYWKRPGSVDGLRSSCKSCGKKRQERWNAVNIERKRATNRRYHWANRQACNAASARSYDLNKDARRLAMRDWAARNPEMVQALNRRKRLLDGDRLRQKRRQHYRDNKARYKAQAAARQKHIKRATPSWADLNVIAAFYAEAERLTAETGILHHVDHFYPLRGKTMCGLHVEGNLRVIPAFDNLKKSNEAPAADPKGDADGSAHRRLSRFPY